MRFPWLTGWSPRPEQLAAYADGELTPAERKRVEDWLNRRPRRWADVEAHRDLADLFRATWPADPTEAAWADAERRIRQRLGPVARHRPWAAPLAYTPALIPVAAAVALVMLWLGRPPAPDPWGANADAPDTYPVMDRHDVEILSMAPGDVGALVVGEHPLSEPVVPASIGDVHITSINWAREGPPPRLRAFPGAATVPIVDFPLNRTRRARGTNADGAAADRAGGR